MPTTIYIAPAAGETHHPQCRIYARDGDPVDNVRGHYRAHPGEWREVGLMNYQGKLVCFSGPDAQRQDLLDCQPLMGGLTFTFD